LKIGGQLILTFHRNEADHGGYQGLHNWNFDMRGGDFVIEHRGDVVNVFNILRPYAAIKILLKQNSNAFKSKVIIAFTKRKDISSHRPLAEN
jgi:hypothetical protein